MDARFVNADLQRVIFNGQIDYEIDPEPGDPLWFDGADFTRARLTGVRIDGDSRQLYSARGTRFVDTRCQNVSFENVDFERADFSGANFTGARFRNAKFQWANFSHADLTQVSLIKVDFSGATFNSTRISLKLPEVWTDAELDGHLHHTGNGGSLITSINSISDEFVSLKLSLMQQLVSAIDRPEIDLRPYAQDLISLMQPGYLADPTLSAFLERAIITPLIREVNTRPWMTREDNLCQALMQWINNRFVTESSPESMGSFLVDNNGFFIQLILNSRRSGNAAIRQQAETLYARYLELPRIRQYTESAYDFGDYEGNALWNTPDATNYILVADDSVLLSCEDQIGGDPVVERRTLLMSEATLRAMLKGEPGTVWNAFFPYLQTSQGEPQAQSNSDPVSLFNRHFRLFAAPYRQQAVLVAFQDDGVPVVPAFNRARFQGATFGRRVNLVGLIGANLRGASFNGTEVYIGVRQLTDASLDALLNHSANNRSLLQTIDSLDDTSLRVKAMAELIELVNREGVNLQPLLENFDILLRPPYFKEGQFRHPGIAKFFADSLAPEIIKTANTTSWKLSVRETAPLCHALLNLLDSRPAGEFSEFVLKNNGFFIQLIYQSRNSGDERLKTRAENLYAEYLKLPRIKKYARAENNLFGDFDGQVAWEYADASNYLLVSDTAAEEKTVMLSEQKLTGMLGTGKKPPGYWGQDIFLYRTRAGAEQLPIAEPARDPEALFGSDFPVFATAYYAHIAALQHGKLWDLFPWEKVEGKDYRGLFIQTLASGQGPVQVTANGPEPRDRLVTPSAQRDMDAIFAGMYVQDNPQIVKFRLTDAHYRTLLEALELKEAVDAHKARALISLAMNFTWLSSSTLLGTELDSPLALRFYASALLAKAYQLDISAFMTPSGQDTYTDWQGRLVPGSGEFSCTQILSGMMKNHARDNFPQVFTKTNAIFQPAATEADAASETESDTGSTDTDTLSDTESDRDVTDAEEQAPGIHYQEASRQSAENVQTVSPEAAGQHYNLILPLTLLPFAPELENETNPAIEKATKGTFEALEAIAKGNGINWEDTEEADPGDADVKGAAAALFRKNPENSFIAWSSLGRPLNTGIWKEIPGLDGRGELVLKDLPPGARESAIWRVLVVIHKETLKDKGPEWVKGRLDGTNLTPERLVVAVCGLSAWSQAERDSFAKILLTGYPAGTPLVLYHAPTVAIDAETGRKHFDGEAYVYRLDDAGELLLPVRKARPDKLSLSEIEQGGQTSLYRLGATSDELTDSEQNNISQAKTRLKEMAAVQEQRKKRVQTAREILHSLQTGELLLQDIVAEQWSDLRAVYGSQRESWQAAKDTAFRVLKKKRHYTELVLFEEALSAGPEQYGSLDAVTALQKFREEEKQAVQGRAEIARVMLSASPELARLGPADPSKVTARVSLLDRVSRVMNPAGKLVFGIGALAAICRLTQIAEERKKGGLTPEREAELNREELKAIRDLAIDAGDEAGDILSLNSQKFAETVQKVQKAWKALSAPGPAPSARKLQDAWKTRGSVTTASRAATSVRSVGRFLTTGLRFTGNLAGPVLGGAGAVLAWISVRETSEALKKEGLSAQKRSELQVDLALAVTTALLSTGLTLTAAVGVIAGGLSALGVSSAVLATAAAVAGPAGLVMGAALMGIFIAQWVTGGVRAVNEVEKYTGLTDWERFRVGLGAMFGLMPSAVKIRYEFEKMVQQLREQKMAEIDSLGLNHRLNDLYGAVETAEVTPGKAVPRKAGSAQRITGTLSRLVPAAAWVEALVPDDVTPPEAKATFGKIDLTTGTYESTHADSATWSVEERERRMHHRYEGRHPVDEASEKEWISSLRLCAPVFMTARNGEFSSVRNSAMNLHGSSGGIPPHARDRAAVNDGRPVPGARLHEGDIDGDGTQDTLSVSASGEITVELLRTQRRDRNPEVRTDRALLTQLFDAGDRQDRKAYLFLHDINEDNRDDLVVVHRDGQLRVALSQGDGRFGAVTDRFVIHGASARENFFSDQNVLGFRPGTGVLLSWRPTGLRDGELYASFVVPVGDDSVRRSWVDFGQKLPSRDNRDVFTAPRNEQGKSFFQVYNTHSQTFTAGPGNDEFHFRLSGAPQFIPASTRKTGGEWLADSVLNGAEGHDHIVFLQQEAVKGGVDVVLGSSSAPGVSFLKSAGAEGEYRLQLIDIESATGTPYDDTLVIDSATGGTLNGNGGMDTLKGGAGDNTLIIERGVAAGGAGMDTYELMNSQVSGELRVAESPAGEYSQILLPCTLSQIRGIYQDELDLCIDIDNGNATIRTLRLDGFYGYLASDEQASRYDIRSRDGLSFRLEAGMKVRGTLLEKDRRLTGDSGWPFLRLAVQSLQPDALRRRLREVPLDDVALWYLLPELTAAQRAAIPEEQQQRLELLSSRRAREEAESVLISVRYSAEDDRALNTAVAVKETHQTAGEGSNPAGMVIVTTDGREEKRTLPALFDLLPSGGMDRADFLTGGPQDEVLAARAGSGATLTGKGGQDVYLVHRSDRPGGVTIDNYDNPDEASGPQQDTLLLPWRFDDIKWSVEGAGLTARHTHLSASGELIRQWVSVIRATKGRQYRHLCIRDADGQVRYLRKGDDGVVWLSDGPLVMKDSSSLELTWASGSLELDARRRVLNEKPRSPTVITDRSRAGNRIYGTLQADNLIRVTGGDNVVQGGDRQDLLCSGTGSDEFDGGSGEDVLYFAAGSGHDRLSGVETLVFSGLSREAVRISGGKNTADLRISFAGAENDSVTLRGYSGDESGQVELQFVAETGMDVVYLAELMASVPSPQTGVATGTSAGTSVAVSPRLSWPLPQTG